MFQTGCNFRMDIRVVLCMQQQVFPHIYFNHCHVKCKCYIIQNLGYDPNGHAGNFIQIIFGFENIYYNLRKFMIFKKIISKFFKSTMVILKEKKKLLLGKKAKVWDEYELYLIYSYLKMVRYFTHCCVLYFNVFFPGVRKVILQRVRCLQKIL